MELGTYSSGFGSLLDALVVLGPSRRPAGASERSAGLDVDVHAQVAQPAEAGGDVERDVVVAAARRGTTARSRRASCISRQLSQRAVAFRS